MAEKRAFAFFNCNESKSPDSMNPLYNQDVYSDSKAGRKALWKKVQEELKAGHIELDGQLEELTKTTILQCDPVDASEDIKYGIIVEVSVH